MPAFFESYRYFHPHRRRVSEYSFVASVVGKIHKLRTDKVRELEAPWISK